MAARLRWCAQNHLAQSILSADSSPLFHSSWLPNDIAILVLAHIFHITGFRATIVLGTRLIAQDKRFQLG